MANPEDKSQPKRDLDREIEKAQAVAFRAMRNVDMANIQKEEALRDLEALEREKAEATANGGQQ